jgi:hypothetical protein
MSMKATIPGTPGKNVRRVMRRKFVLKFDPKLCYVVVSAMSCYVIQPRTIRITKTKLCSLIFNVIIGKKHLSQTVF